MLKGQCSEISNPIFTVNQVKKFQFRKDFEQCVSAYILHIYIYIYYIYIYIYYIYSLGRKKKGRKRSRMGRGEKEEIWNGKRREGRDLECEEERSRMGRGEKEERRKREGAAVRWNVCM